MLFLEPNATSAFLWRCGALLLALCPAPSAGRETPSDAELYQRACAACHGDDGRGRPQEELLFATPPPDFTDCEFASREPDPDWHAVIHEGGPVRAFDRMMPAFGDALTDEEIYAILRHVRTFCANDAWPRGEFNLPRPLFTEKAFPEDEIVVTLGADGGSAAAVEAEYLYEKRFGPRSMVEVAVPFGYREMPADASGGGNFGLGDIALGVKHTLHHDLQRGSIFSLGAEAILPTGSESKGLGAGATVFEPFAAYAQLLPGDAFIQAQALAEFAVDGRQEDKAALRFVLGKTWASGEFGRAWSPMLEVLTERNLAAGAQTNLDLAPQVQIALNTRQHILLNLGLRIPVNNTEGRDVQFVVYLLWDWFDGGFFDGW